MKLSEAALRDYQGQILIPAPGGNYPIPATQKHIDLVPLLRANVGALRRAIQQRNEDSFTYWRDSIQNHMRQHHKTLRAAGLLVEG